MVVNRPFYCLNTVAYDVVPVFPTFYARKRLFDTRGAFDTTFKVSADFELMLRFFERGDITSRYIPMVFVKMRMGGESTGSIKRIIEGNRNVMRAFKKNSLPVSPLYPIRRLLPKAYNILKNKIGRGRWLAKSVVRQDDIQGAYRPQSDKRIIKLFLSSLNVTPQSQEGIQQRRSAISL